MENTVLVFEKVAPGEPTAGHVDFDMPPARRERFSQLKNQAQRAQYAASTRALERALFEFTGGAGAYLSFRYGENGRPVADGAQISLAHTDGMAACAVGRAAVGVDIERRDRKFSAAMQKRYPTLDDWLALEACVKMTGEGLNAIGKYVRAGGEMRDLAGDLAGYVSFLDHGDFRVAVCSATPVQISDT